MQFTTNAYPKQQRKDAWNFVLQRFSLSLLMSDEEPYGELASFKTGQNIQFIRIACTSQTIAMNLDEGQPCFWMILALEGGVTVTSSKSSKDIKEGDIIYGGSNTPIKLTLLKESRFLIICVPDTLPVLKSRVPLQKDISNLVSETTMGRMFSGLLRSVADVIADVTDDQLRPIETALPEFIAATLINNAPAKELGGAAGAKAALLERIFQSIEIRLSDPDLNVYQIAKEQGVSTRYLQKLFETTGDSFSHFVKDRRLERCRLDLRSPLHAQRTISEILFQWGFNDSASFSRAFREKYGISPRDYRRAPPEEIEVNPVLQRGRPEGLKDQKIDKEFSSSDLEENNDHDEESVEVQNSVRHHHLPATPETIHWGYFSSALKPAVTVQSGDYVTIEALTHHAYDDYERMIKGDPGAEAVFEWTADHKAVDRRGAGPMDATSEGRGAGEGYGVHICTGPVEIAGAKPGDIVEVRILDINPRPSANHRYAGRSFGSNLAAFWGFHFSDILTEPTHREVVTIYEVEKEHGRACAHAVYNYRWTPQTDPFGVLHERYDYPGVPVDHSKIEKNYDILRNVEIPIRPHFGVIGLAPPVNKLVDSVPPSNFGGNLDNWRIGPGTSLFLPVGVDGAMLSIGDPHASQGDSELCGTAIECSMTALIQPILHTSNNMRGYIKDLDYPLLETTTEWVIFGFSHPDYLKELGVNAQSDIYKKSSIDLAMRDCFRKARRFLMSAKTLSEDEAISLLSVGIDFGISQVANGNWGVHAVIRKELFNGGD